MEIFEQDFHEGMILDEHYQVFHHNKDKPLYEKRYRDFTDEDTVVWGGVQVVDLQDNWIGWLRVWPVKG
jgi:hypothetical protein